MFKKALLSLTAGALLFNASSALAADYQIDKQGQHAFCAISYPTLRL